jgi:uncharacterized membrane protein
MPILLLIVLYLTIRFSLNLQTAHLGGDRYEYHIGKNLLINPLLLFVQSAIVGSSVDIFSAAKEHDIPALCVPAVLTIALVGSALTGFILSGRWKLLVVLMLSFFASLFVVIGLNHVGELYAYNSTPIFALYTAIGVTELWNRSVPKYRSLLIILAVAVCAVHITSVRSKSALMRQQGEYASRIIPQIVPYAEKLPYQGELVCINTSKEIEYSIFKRNDFNSIQDGLAEIYRRSRRHDIRIEIANSPVSSETVSHESTFLLIDGNKKIRSVEKVEVSK